MNIEKDNQERWQRLKNIFSEAVDLAPESRSVFLSALRLDEKTLCQEVVELIEIDEEAADFLGQPISLESNTFRSPPSLLGETVGHYKIVREIERGGMGVVFEGKRFDGAFEQRVAVKLVNRHCFSDELIRRFVKERHILAQLEHPHIVRLLDGGLTDDRTPYYVMEFIEGMSVNVYCRENDLDATETLSIFLQICQAVAYAHRQLIVHRDLKPSNILITKTGEAKLLDFGIAKILDPDAAAQTQTQNAPFTPAYASPEQIRGETISTLSDVYSLGVILYELLTGQTPTQIYRTNNAGLPQAICGTEPVVPSRAWRDAELQSYGATEKNRQASTLPTASTTRPVVAAQLKGDLDNIVLKALQKETTRRYDSVEQFADDIKSYLKGLPVKAHPPSFEYRASKFVKRNQLAVGLATAAILLITSGVIAAIWQTFEARKQQQIAEQRFDQVRKIANSFIFDYHDEIAKLDGSTKLRERLVSDGVNYLDAVAQGEDAQPDLLKESAIGYRKIGDAQGKPYLANLGKLEDAVQSYQKSVMLLERALPLAPHDLSLKEELVLSYRTLSTAVGRSGNREQARQISQKALAVNKELIAADENNVERKISSLKLQVALGDAEGSFEIYQRALDEANELIRFEPKNENLIRLMKMLHSRVGNFYRFRGNSEISKGNTEAGKNWYLQALEHSYREVYYMEANPTVITDKHWIYNGYESHAENLSKLGRNDEAMANLEIAEKTLQELKKNNADDREIELMEIAFLSIRQSVLKQQGKTAAALADEETAFNLAVKRTESDPTNIEPITWTLNLVNKAGHWASEQKKEREAENYRQICRKYGILYKDRFGSEFNCDF